MVWKEEGARWKQESRKGEKDRRRGSGDTIRRYDTERNLILFSMSSHMSPTLLNRTWNKMEHCGIPQVKLNQMQQQCYHQYKRTNQKNHHCQAVLQAPVHLKQVKWIQLSLKPNTTKRSRRVSRVTALLSLMVKGHDQDNKSVPVPNSAVASKLPFSLSLYPCLILIQDLFLSFMFLWGR